MSESRYDWTKEGPFSPRSQALAIIRAKFAGVVPSAVTTEECLELMVFFAAYESERADVALDLCNRITQITAKP